MCAGQTVLGPASSSFQESSNRVISDCTTKFLAKIPPKAAFEPEFIAKITSFMQETTKVGLRSTSRWSWPVSFDSNSKQREVVSKL